MCPQKRIFYMIKLLSTNKLCRYQTPLGQTKLKRRDTNTKEYTISEYVCVSVWFNLLSCNNLSIAFLFCHINLYVVCALSFRCEHVVFARVHSLVYYGSFFLLLRPISNCLRCLRLIVKFLFSSLSFAFFLRSHPSFSPLATENSFALLRSLIVAVYLH